jgi:hypothetical protein
MTTIFFANLRYPLRVTTFTRTQREDILRPVLQTTLSASGIYRNISRAAVHGPLEYQDLGITDLYTLQGLAHIQLLLRFGKQIPMQGQLPRTSLEQLRLKLGIPVGLPTAGWLATWCCLHEQKKTI